MDSQKKYTRRNCLKFMGILSASTLLPNFFIQPAFSKTSPNIKKFSRTLPFMSTYVTIIIYDPSWQKAQEAQEMAFKKIKELINVFNRFDDNAQIGWLNKNKKLTEFSPHILTVLNRAKYISKFTSGKFDVTILPLLETIKYEIEFHGHFPSPKIINEILPSIGWNNLHVDPQKITLSADSKITLDGIAKGYIVDMAAEVIKSYKIRHAIIDAGGDIRAIGAKPNSPWIIGIEDPYLEKKYIRIVKLKDLAIATSGDYRNFFDPNKRFYHIIDKQGRISPQRTMSCSVIAENATTADGLATGLYLFAPEESMRLANKNNIPILMVTHGRRTFVSRAMRNFLA